MGTKDAMNPHLHELFHALGFVQLCAPKAVIEKIVDGVKMIT